MSTSLIAAPVELKEDNFEAFVSPDGISVVDFWATWCGPCRAFAPVFEKAAATHLDIRFGKVNTEEQPGLAEAFNIQAIPTLMIFRDRVLLYAEAGALPPAAFEELLLKVKALDMDDVRRQIAEADAEGNDGEG